MQMQDPDARRRECLQELVCLLYYVEQTDMNLGLFIRNGGIDKVIQQMDFYRNDVSIQKVSSSILGHFVRFGLQRDESMANTGQTSKDIVSSELYAMNQALQRVVARLLHNFDDDESRAYATNLLFHHETFASFVKDDLPNSIIQALKLHSEHSVFCSQLLSTFVLPGCTNKDFVQGLLDAGMWMAVTRLLQTHRDTPSLLYTVCSVLRALSKGTKRLPFAIVQELSDALRRHLESHELTRSICWIMREQARRGEEARVELANARGVHRLVRVLVHYPYSRPVQAIVCDCLKFLCSTAHDSILLQLSDSVAAEALGMTLYRYHNDAFIAFSALYVLFHIEEYITRVVRDELDEKSVEAVVSGGETDSCTYRSPKTIQQ